MRKQLTAPIRLALAGILLPVTDLLLQHAKPEEPEFEEGEQAAFMDMCDKLLRVANVLIKSASEMHLESSPRRAASLPAAVLQTNLISAQRLLAGHRAGARDPSQGLRARMP